MEGILGSLLTSGPDALAVCKRMVREIADLELEKAGLEHDRSGGAEHAARDARVKTALRKDGLEVLTGNAALLFTPDRIRKRDGGPFQVFTPFWKAALARPEPAAPQAAPGELKPPQAWPEGVALDAL